MRHAQAHSAPKAVLEPEHVIAHQVPAPRFLPNLRGMNRRQKEFLRPDAVHFFAHDRRNLQYGSLRKVKVVIDPRRKLAYVSGTQQQPMARHFSLSRIITKSRYKQLAPEHGGCLAILTRSPVFL